MKKRKQQVGNPRPRDALASNHHNYSPITTAVTVRRPVIIEDEHAERLERRLNRQVKRRLPGRKNGHFKVLPPAEWAVTHVEKGKLTRQLQAAETQPSRRDMWMLAGQLRRLLLQLLENEPSGLSLPLGSAKRFGFGDQRIKPAMGMQAEGWRGSRARYAERDQAGNLLPLGALAAENAACVRAISDSMGLEESAAAETMSKTPHISVLRNPQGIRDHEFRILAPLVEEVMPDEVTLGDPVIYLHDKGYARPFEITLRPGVSGEWEPARRQAA